MVRRKSLERAGRFSCPSESAGPPESLSSGVRRNMNDRDEIISDQPFWSRLEYSATVWLATAADRNLRRFWIDGFMQHFNILHLRTFGRGLRIRQASVSASSRCLS